jgi:hypothetical protein
MSIQIWSWSVIVGVSIEGYMIIIPLPRARCLGRRDYAVPTMVIAKRSIV